MLYMLVAHGTEEEGFVKEKGRRGTIGLVAAVAS